MSRKINPDSLPWFPFYAAEWKYSATVMKMTRAVCLQHECCTCSVCLQYEYSTYYFPELLKFSLTLGKNGSPAPIDKIRRKEIKRENNYVVANSNSTGENDPEKAEEKDESQPESAWVKLPAPASDEMEFLDVPDSHPFSLARSKQEPVEEPDPLDDPSPIKPKMVYKAGVGMVPATTKSQSPPGRKQTRPCSHRCPSAHESNLCARRAYCNGTGRDAKGRATA